MDKPAQSFHAVSRTGPLGSAYSKKVIFRLGVVLLAGSQVPYLGIIALPLMGLDWTTVGIGAVALVMTGEVLFWVGVLLIGRDTWRTARRHGLRRTPRALWHLFRYGREAEPRTS